jgi:NAD+ diphosphatase
MMIHKIDPHKYYPEFRNQEPKTSDYLLLFDGEKVYLPGKTTPSENSSVGFLPTFEEVHDLLQIRQPIDRFFLDCEYLFSIDDKAFYRKTAEDAGALMIPEDHLYPSGVFRNFEPEYLAFAGITATQINRFRLDRRYCGRCGHPTIPSTTERACICPECGQIEYPKISPAVIIAIVDTGRDKILLTRYAGGSYRHWALVAGFVEVGETFKGAARREIMEEVGLKVSDLVYYKSQPWSFSDSAMIGFFAKLDGDSAITLQESELGEAKWFSREEVPDLPSTISVGQEMISLFKNGGDPFCQK